MGRWGRRSQGPSRPCRQDLCTCTWAARELRREIGRPAEAWEGTRESMDPDPGAVRPISASVETPRPIARSWRAAAVVERTSRSVLTRDRTRTGRRRVAPDPTRQGVCSERVVRPREETAHRAIVAKVAVAAVVMPGVARAVPDRTMATTTAALVAAGVRTSRRVSRSPRPHRSGRVRAPARTTCTPGCTPTMVRVLWC